jgi:hypothetical protein
MQQRFNRTLPKITTSITKAAQLADYPDKVQYFTEYSIY